MTPTLLANGFCFGEGPRWFEGLLWFSDLLGENVHTVTMAGAMTTIPLPGHRPAGLGFRPDGSLLIVSTETRRLLRYDGDHVTVAADLSELVPAALGDMVVDAQGRAYIGSQARSGGVIVRVDPGDDGENPAIVVADDLDFPNGMVITPDGDALIVAESTGRRLTVFTVAADGSLTDRRSFADQLSGPPDGIALDASGGVWTALTLANRFERIIEGGEVTDRIDLGDRVAIACALGGAERRDLFLLSTTDAYPERLIGTTNARLDVVTVDVPGAGIP